MKAEILSIGTEILLGEIVDTNSQYIASRLPALGIDLYFKHTVGDNFDRLRETLGRAFAANDLVITTGGLGPTEDDLTREAIAALMGEEPKIDAALEEALRARFNTQRFGYMPERNLKQAWLIPSARAIPNPRGTAPGWWVEHEGKIIVAMPGPPSEMTRMWQEEVAPELARRNPGIVLVSRTIKTSGIGEGALDETIPPLLKSTNPSIGVYARADGVHVRMAAKAPTAAEARALIEPMEAELRGLLGPVVWGVDEDTLEKILRDQMVARGLTLAVMESFTGGLLADTITNVPGSSDFFRGGIVAYAADVKRAMGVDPEVIERFGVYSAETAVEMARAARERLGTSIGIGTTGVAGSEAEEGTPPGQVYIGLVNDQGESLTTSFLFNQGREAVKRRGVTQSLALLRRSLNEA